MEAVTCRASSSAHSHLEFSAEPATEDEILPIHPQLRVVMTTFKALLVLRNTNPVCQSSLWGLAEPCRDRLLPSRSSCVTQLSCLHQRVMRNSPGQGWQRCHRKGMPGWSPAPPVPRVSPAPPGASTSSPPSPNTTLCTCR